MSAYRKIVNPETHANFRDGEKYFYLLSVDVGRVSCQTVVTVIKVLQRPEGFHCRIVNLFVLGKNDNERHFEYQARDLKRLIRDFQPKEVVIDGNGLGVGLLDFMARPQVDPQTGEIYPIYGSFNDPDMLKTQPKDAIPIIYVIKASAKQNSEMHSNCYSRIYSGHVYFLIKEQEAKNRLLSTKVGQKMNTEQKARRLLPHELTTILFDEIGNLRLKQTGRGSDVVLEQINSRVGKDKFSSLEYGLWRVKELEDAYLKTKGKRTKKRDLIFFTPGG